MNAGPRAAAVEELVAREMTAIADITLDLLGLAYYGMADSRTTLTYFLTNPFSMDGTKALGWSSWRRRRLAPYEQQTDLQIRWDISGTDPSLYSLNMVVYNNVVYKGAAEFRAAWVAGKIEKRPLMPEDSSFIRKDRKGPVRDLEDRMAPVIVEPEGKRYKIDAENKYFEYLGWKFYVRVDKDVGVQFYDVKFKDERILYELSMQGQSSRSTLFSMTTY